MLSVNWKRSLLFLAAALAIHLVLHAQASAQLGGRGGMGGGGGGPAPPGPKETRRYQPPKFAPSGPKVPVAEVRLKGHLSVSESRIRGKLQTREGRSYDPNTVQADVRQLLASGLCYDVKTFKQESPNGIIITFELFEQPRIGYVRFAGTKVREKTLLKKSELAIGQPLNRYRVEEAARNLEEYFKSRGNSFVEVNIAEGTNEGDRGVAFEINEGPRQRIAWTKFEGNTIASDARLKTLIESKPGILWIFKGKVDRDIIDEDKDKLTAYYRSLGFFRARIEKQMDFDEDQEWLTLTYLIDEGPRYVIRKITVEGNEVFGQDELLTGTDLQPGDFFDQAKVGADMRLLKDAYGANGYIKSVVDVEPQFFEEPGQLDLIYKVSEGGQYRVGEIKVNIDGEFPHTRQNVILNRINLREGDIIDIRKVRNSERRLGASQLFETGPMGGPEIAVQPREIGTQLASPPQSRSQF